LQKRIFKKALALPARFHRQQPEAIQAALRGGDLLKRALEEILALVMGLVDLILVSCFLSLLLL
jgi:hypothetical protein